MSKSTTKSTKQGTYEKYTPKEKAETSCYAWYRSHNKASPCLAKHCSNHEIFNTKINNFTNLECFLCLENLELYSICHYLRCDPPNASESKGIGQQAWLQVPNHLEHDFSLVGLVGLRLFYMQSVACQELNNVQCSLTELTRASNTLPWPLWASAQWCSTHAIELACAPWLQFNEVIFYPPFWGPSLLYWKREIGVSPSASANVNVPHLLVRAVPRVGLGDTRHYLGSDPQTPQNLKASASKPGSKCQTI